MVLPLKHKETIVTIHLENKLISLYEQADIWSSQSLSKFSKTSNDLKTKVLFTIGEKYDQDFVAYTVVCTACKTV